MSGNETQTLWHTGLRSIKLELSPKSSTPLGKHWFIREGELYDFEILFTVSDSLVYPQSHANCSLLYRTPHWSSINLQKRVPLAVNGYGSPSSRIPCPPAILYKPAMLQVIPPSFLPPLQELHVFPICRIRHHLRRRYILFNLIVGLS
jgi:hypothetical protein